MEWLETTARSVEDAKELLLDQLGVDAEDAEFEVVEEPKPGLFGRVRGEARVRARVRPAQVRQKVERRDRKKKDKPSEGSGAAEAPASAVVAAEPAAAPKAAPAPAPARERAPRPETTVTPTEVGAEAQRFMDGLLDAFGIEHTTNVSVEGEHIDVRVEGEQLGLLVGPRGTTLQAVQEITRIVAQRKLGDHETRLTVDVGGYRQRRQEALARFATQIANDVLGSGEARALEPMNSSDRKVVHDTLSAIEGIDTRSEGDDPNRRVVIVPANA
jgi:spoIIIJ-associated protein